MTKVLIGSPVHQLPEVLREFLTSLKELNKEGLTVEYCFVDDNSNEESKNLLRDFSENMSGVVILDSKYDINYICDDYTHRWSEDLVMKVTDFKNKIIDFAKEKEYDYLFFIDSDIVLHQKTLKRLLSTGKEIISNIFWTKWSPQTQELPQVWLKDSYTLYDSNENELITQGEVERLTFDFLQKLKKPGTYKVGGLGACTLISKSALEKGVNFNPIYNISFWGEDRHFCIRAAVLEIELYVDTYYPAYHIYRSEDLAGVAEYKANKERREAEILGAKLLDQVIAGVQEANHYSYKEDLNTSFTKYFTKKCGFRLKTKLEENDKKVREEKLVNNLQVMECQLTFYNNNSMVIANLKYNEQGYKNGYSYYKEAEGDCTLLVDQKGNWLIDDWKMTKKKIPKFIPLVRKVKEENNRLTLSMIVKNEGKRYLRRALESAREYIDDAVIIDDGSTDDTIEIIKEVLKDIPFTLIENKYSKFSNEIELRKQQWFETIETNPDWILFLDADEIFENKFKDDVREMMKNIEVDGYIFRLYDFWDEDHYRDDNLWCAHNTYRLFMIRYQKNFRYLFTETAQHCGRMPANCMKLSYALSNLRLKHYGWAKLEDRLNKYQRYMQLDPNGEFGSMDQYKSILDPRPKLTGWNENE